MIVGREKGCRGGGGLWGFNLQKEVLRKCGFLQFYERVHNRKEATFEPFR